MLTDLARTRGIEVAGLISDTVRAWDARTMSERIEGAIGRDLQYIRLNGTLTGGLIGLLLYMASRYVAWPLRRGVCPFPTHRFTSTIAPRLS